MQKTANRAVNPPEIIYAVLKLRSNHFQVTAMTAKAKRDAADPTAKSQPKINGARDFSIH